MASSVLFVCLGNICRSPLAEGVLRHRLAAVGLDRLVAVDSAGTGGWHAGDPPDRRSIATAARRGIDIAGLAARQVTAADFDRFDLVLGMDRQNVKDLRRLARGGRARVALFLDEALGLDEDVPDPYYGDIAGFEAVYDLCDRGAAVLVTRLIGLHGQGRSTDAEFGLGVPTE